MEKATIIGIDLAKRVLQVHAAAKDGRPVLRKKVSRAQLLDFLAKRPPAVVAMEACATAHDWGRAISGLGHDVRLVPPIYVKPFVRRQKNDAADAEAIAEAASRPTMRFVALKTEEQQARSMIFRTRDLLVRQRTQLVNALRGHLAEHGIVAAHGLAQMKALATAMRDTAALHPLVRELGQRYLDHIARLDVEIAELDKRLRRSCKDDETAKRLQTMPGMGRSPPPRSRPLRRRWRPLGEDATLPPGSASFHGNRRLAGRRGWVGRQRWGSATSAGFSSSAP
jgi:transposase